MLQNIRTQTHKSPLIQQNQPKSNSNSIQRKQMHKLRNTTCEEGRNKKEKEKESYPVVKKEERKKEKKKKKKKQEEEKRLT